MLQSRQPGSRASRTWFKVSKRLIRVDIQTGIRLNKRRLEVKVRRSDDMPSGNSYRKLHKHSMWCYVN